MTIRFRLLPLKSIILTEVTLVYSNIRTEYLIVDAIAPVHLKNNNNNSVEPAL